MSDEQRANDAPDGPVETQSETTGGMEAAEAQRDAARDLAADAIRQREAAAEAAADIARERDLAAAEANRFARERNAAATVAAVESEVADQNAFGFWMMVAIVVAILVIAAFWAASRRPWEGPTRNVNTITVQPSPGTTGTAPAPGGVTPTPPAPAAPPAPAPAAPAAPAPTGTTTAPPRGTTPPPATTPGPAENAPGNTGAGTTDTTTGAGSSGG